MRKRSRALFIWGEKSSPSQRKGLLFWGQTKMAIHFGVKRLKNALLRGEVGCWTKMIKKSWGRNLNKTTPSSDRFSGVLILDERFFAQVMELIHLQEDLELDGFPSGVVLRCVCGPKIVGHPKPGHPTWSFPLTFWGHQSNVLKVWYDLLHGPTWLMWLRILQHSNMGVNPKIGVPHPPKWMVYKGKRLLELMIWGYLYFWKHPYFTHLLFQLLLLTGQENRGVVDCDSVNLIIS